MRMWVALGWLAGLLPASIVLGQPLTYFGSVYEFKGDSTCGRDTGGLHTYVHTRNYDIYICGDPRDPSQARFYRSFEVDGRPGLSLVANTYSPQQGRYLIFDNGGYEYILDPGTATTRLGLLIVRDPQGTLLLEEVASTWLSR